MNKTRMLCLAAVVSLMSTGAYADLQVKVGVLNDRSGLYSDVSGEGSVIAARMAVEDFGAAEKGIEVEILSADHQNKPDVGSTIARRWIDQESVDVIADVPTSSVALAVAEIVEDKDRVFLVSGPGSSDLTGSACSPNLIHWTYDTYATSKVAGGAMVEAGGDTWFFLTADYAYGHALERDTAVLIEEAGGELLGSVKTPFPNTDFSSYLLQAQSSGAKVIGLATAGADLVNAVKQAAEFGITQSGQNLASLASFISEVHALGLDTAQGLVIAESFYWDLNDETREWSRRFAEQNNGNMPTMVQAGVYASILHYLKAVEATQSKDAGTVIEKMKGMPTDDPLFGEGEIREDGRKLHDFYLFEVKSPEESEYDWDYYNVLATVPGDVAFRPIDEGNCRFVQ